MDNRQRQVTDNIHETIYLSDLESEIISTPAFNRLNDVYQSSTVFTAFPSNRTKRYEHSLGTMDLTSEVFYFSFSNAGECTREQLLSQCQYYLKETIKYLENLYENNENTEIIYLPRDRESKDILAEIFNFPEEDKNGFYKDFKKEIKETLKEGHLDDPTLNFYQHGIKNFLNLNKNNAVDIFLFQAFLQAVRLVGLLHDVGHPPFSHIIEEILEDVYNEVNENPENYNDRKLRRFKNRFNLYFSKNEDFKVKVINTPGNVKNCKGHEKIGITIVEDLLEKVFQSHIIKVIHSNYDLKIKRGIILYYILVAEFTMGILTEKNDFFKSFHKIVDGIIDSDRLDYVMRDSINSGVMWYKIPYRRLLRSAKLFSFECLDEENKKELENKVDLNSHETNSIFLIAFPAKTKSEIEDLLIARYKIFVRINLHHKVAKSAGALKKSTKELILNYLDQNNKDISEDISFLWEYLTYKSLLNSQFANWNDSKLTQELNSALGKLEDNRNNDLRIQYPDLNNSLREYLRNEDNLIPIIRRGYDSRNLVKDILEAFGQKQIDIKKKIEELKYEEFKEAYKSKNTSFEDYLDYLYNEGTFNNGDIGTLSTIYTVYETKSLETLLSVPLFGKDFLKEILEGLEGSTINRYLILQNGGRAKKGIPGPTKNCVFDHIYLYNVKNFVEPMDMSVVEKQLDLIFDETTPLFLYVEPDKYESGQNIKEEVRNSIIEKFADKFKEKFDEGKYE